MSRPTRVTINLAALTHNFNMVREFAPKSRVIAMVKANAYGHGMLRVAQHLKEADAFGVASMEEGLVLRAAGIRQPIVLVEGLFVSDDVALAAANGFELVVHDEYQLRMLELAPQDLPAMRVWLKINTGMNRLGVLPENVDRIYQRLLNLSIVAKPIGLMTHFADADAVDLTSAGKQLASFQAVVAGYSGPFSLANSAAIIALPDSRADWVRPGLMLYGVSPRADGANLMPVMTFWSRLISVYDVEKGGKVGYGGTWVASEKTRIGIVAAGYGDGYPQSAKNGTPVLVNDVRCELIGRVSMDMLAVDLTNCLSAVVDNRVVLWGEGLAVAEVAAFNQFSPYELLTRMTGRAEVEVVS